MRSLPNKTRIVEHEIFQALSALVTSHIAQQEGVVQLYFAEVHF